MFTWTDSDGVVVSTGNTLTLRRAGDFSLTCTATGNFTTPCNASDSVSGTATGKEQHQSTGLTSLASGCFSLILLNGFYLTICSTGRDTKFTVFSFTILFMCSYGFLSRDFND